MIEGAQIFKTIAEFGACVATLHRCELGVSSQQPTRSQFIPWQVLQTH